MIGTVLDVFRLARDVWPKRWSNVRVEFRVEEMGLAFVCDAKGAGVVRVTLLDRDGQTAGYVEGANAYNVGVRVGYNAAGHSHALLADCFQMARSYREFERTGDIDFSRHYQHFRERAVFQWERARRDEEEAERQ